MRSEAGSVEGGAWGAGSTEGGVGDPRPRRPTPQPRFPTPYTLLPTPYSRLLSLLWAAVCAAGCGELAERAERAEGRRAQLAAASPGKKSDLLQAAARLEALDPAERERLRRLNRRIDDDPEGAALRQVAARYYDWLKGLPMYRRAEIMELPPEERIAAVKKAVQEEEERSLRRPGPEDADALLDWMRQYAQRHEAAVLATLPPERQPELASDPEHRLRVVMSALWMRWQPGRRGALPAPDENDRAEVLARLSPRTRQKLASKPVRDQWKLIAGWARYLVHYQGDRDDGWLTPEVSEAELIHFFEYELSAEQRDALLALPGEEMQRQLRRLYFRIKLPRPESGPLERLEPHRPEGP